mgnify:CR=1 FL=1
MIDISQAMVLNFNQIILKVYLEHVDHSEMNIQE